jgi:hypothetical protein
MVRTPARDEAHDDAQLYPPAWARERSLPVEGQPPLPDSPIVTPESDPPLPDQPERSPPRHMQVGIGGPTIDPPRLRPRPQCEGNTPVNSSHEVNVPRRLLRIRSEQTRRRVARVSFLLMVAGIAAYGLTVVTSRDRIVLLSPPDEPETYGLVSPATPGSAAWPDRGVALQAPAMKLKLSPDETAMLIGRGQDMLRLGDMPAARLLLRRAAVAGNSEAAFLLASTFDPMVIQEVGVIGFAPDLNQALAWYEKASALGSEEAKRRIERLGYAMNR